MSSVRVCLLLLLWPALLGASPPAAEAPPAVSLREVLADPVAFHGDRVRVQGFLFIEFEGQTLWASESDFRNDAWENTAWLDLELIEPEDFDHPLNGRLVFVTGVVDADGDDLSPGIHGHLGLFGTTITDITQIAPDPADTEAPRPWRSNPLSQLMLLFGLLALFALMIGWGVHAQRNTRLDG